MHQKRRSGSNNNSRNHRGGRNNKYRGGGGGNDSQSLARQKKHAQTQKEKYQNMARDAQVNGERVDAEYYFQHVEHYVRVLAEIEAKEPKPERREESQNTDSDDANAPSDEAKASAPEGNDEAGENAAENDTQEQSAKPKNPRGRRRAAPRSKDEGSSEIPLPSSVIPQAEPLEDAKAASSS